MLLLEMLIFSSTTKEFSGGKSVKDDVSLSMRASICKPSLSW